VKLLHCWFTSIRDSLPRDVNGVNGVNDVNDADTCIDREQDPDSAQGQDPSASPSAHSHSKRHECAGVHSDEHDSHDSHDSHDDSHVSRGSVGVVGGGAVASIAAHASRWGRRLLLRRRNESTSIWRMCSFLSAKVCTWFLSFFLSFFLHLLFLLSFLLKCADAVSGVVRRAAARVMTAHARDGDEELEVAIAALIEAAMSAPVEAYKHCMNGMMICCKIMELFVVVFSFIFIFCNSLQIERGFMGGKSKLTFLNWIGWSLSFG